MQISIGSTAGLACHKWCEFKRVILKFLEKSLVFELTAAARTNQKFLIRINSGKAKKS